MSGEISKDAFVIYLFIYMLCLLTVFNYLSDFHSGGPLWVFNIFEENILDHSPSICFKKFVKFLCTHPYLSWMINSRLNILESTSFCSFFRNNFMSPGPPWKVLSQIIALLWNMKRDGNNCFSLRFNEIMCSSCGKS